jgi:predicted PurR-regulated permease PerM
MVMAEQPNPGEEKEPRAGDKPAGRPAGAAQGQPAEGAPGRLAGAAREQPAEGAPGQPVGAAQERPASGAVQAPGSRDRLRRAGESAWRWLGIIGVTWVILYLVVLIKVVILPIIIAMFITALLYPAAVRLRRHGMNRALSTVVVWVGGLLLFSGLIAFLVPPTAAGLSQLGDSFGKAGNDLRALAVAIGLDEQRLTELVAQARQYISEQGSQIAMGALAGAKTFGEIVVGLVLALILSIYFLHGGDQLFRWLIEHIPGSAGGRLAETGEVIFDVVGRYVRGIAVVGFVDAFFIGLALWILGVPIALPLAVLTFVGAFLPVVGAFMAGLLAAVVAFVAKGWLVALIVVAVTILVQQIEGHVLAPQIYGRALDLPGAAVLIAIAVGSVLAGIVGAFLAAPVAAVLFALIKRFGTAPAPT